MLQLARVCEMRPLIILTSLRLRPTLQLARVCEMRLEEAVEAKKQEIVATRACV